MLYNVINVILNHAYYDFYRLSITKSKTVNFKDMDPVAKKF